MEIIIAIIVLLLVYSVYKMFIKETFENLDSTKVLVFVSKSCPHCVTFNNNVYPTLQQKLSNSNVELVRIFSHEDKEKLFDKYNVQYVPACYVIKNDKEKQLNGQITYDNIMSLM